MSCGRKTVLNDKSVTEKKCSSFSVAVKQNRGKRGGTAITISPCVLIILYAPLVYTDLVTDGKWQLKVQPLLRNVDGSFIFILYLFLNK